MAFLSGLSESTKIKRICKSLKQKWENNSVSYSHLSYIY